MDKNIHQGIDGLNFKLNLSTVKIKPKKFQKQSFVNDNGNIIVTMNCVSNCLYVYVNLSNAIRDNNVIPFRLSDCLLLESAKDRITGFITEALLSENYSKAETNIIIRNLKLTKIECNTTAKCVGKCTPQNVIYLFERAFPKVSIFKEKVKNEKAYNKSTTGFVYVQKHEYVLKVYDKTLHQLLNKNQNVENNLIRIELVFLERNINEILENKSLEKVLSMTAIIVVIKHYQKTFDTICNRLLKDMLTCCKDELYYKLITSKSGNQIKDTVLNYKEYIVDIEVLRKALKKWYEYKNISDHSKQVINIYRNDKYGLPADVLTTIKAIHNIGQH